MVSEEVFNEVKHQVSVLKEYIVFSGLNINVVTSQGTLELETQKWIAD
jgi:hypothetical protein